MSTCEQDSRGAIWAALIGVEGERTQAFGGGLIFPIALF